MATITQRRTPVRATGQQDPGLAARHRAGLVAVMAGFGVPVWFWVTMALWGLGDTPPPGASAQDLLDFYVDNYAGFSASATAYVVLWVLLPTAWLLARSDLWGHITMAVLTAVVGVSSAGYMLLGSESPGAMLTVPWGLAVAIVLLVGRVRHRPEARRDPPSRRHHPRHWSGGGRESNPPGGSTPPHRF